MLLRILLALLGLQLLDLWLLVVLSRSIGFGATLAVVIGVGLLGSTLARRESGRVFGSFQAALAEGRPPEQGLVDGMLVLLGGVLLLLPGILSDVLGFALLVPPLRRALAAALRARWSRQLGQRAPRAVARAARFGAAPEPRPRPQGPAVIDTTGVEAPE